MRNRSTEHDGLLAVSVDNASNLFVALFDKDTTIDFCHSESLLAVLDFLHDLLKSILIETLVSNDVILDAREPSTGNGFFKTYVYDFVAEDFTYVLEVSTIRCCCKAKSRAREVLNDRAIRFSVSVMTFIYDQEVEMVFRPV